MRPRAFPLVRFAFVLSGLALAMQYRPRPLAAQNSSAPPDSNNPPLTATLLKRLGSAVDGYRDGKERWVVISIIPPHTILGVDTSKTAATSLLPKGPSSYRVEGPYVAPPDARGLPKMFMLCKSPDSQAPCGIDSLPIPPTPIDSILSIDVTFILKNRQTRTASFHPQDVEAVFFTLSAIDRLLVPYYTAIYGVAIADSLRHQYFNFATQGALRQH